MTLAEYNKKMSEYADQLSELFGNEWEDLYEEMSKFQQNYMENVLTEYKKTIDSEAKKYVYELLEYAVRWSESGSAILTVETKEMADAIEDIIGEDIGYYLLDWRVYEWKGKWKIDCIFGGYYVPYWDGWDEE